MLRRFGAALLALCLGLLLAEGAARLALAWLGERESDEPELERREDERRTAMHGERARWLGTSVVHPYLGFSGAPKDGEPDSELAQLGFHSGALVRNPDPQRFVVGIFGGSVAEDFALDRGPERAFAKLAGKREVVAENFAIGGFKQPQQLLALTYLLALGAHFDAVLLLDGFNDVTLAPAENVPAGVSPIYPRSWGLLLADLDANRDVRRIIATIGLYGDWRNEMERLEGSRLGLAALAGRLGRNWLEAQLLEARVRLAQERMAAKEAYQVTGPRLDRAGDAEVYALLADLWRHSSLQMARLCSANGIRFVHVLQPNQYAGKKPMGPDETRVAIWWDHPYARPAERGYPHLRAAGAELRQAGVEFHDFTDAFSSVTEPVYYDSCCHFDARGNEILADAMASALE